MPDIVINNGLGVSITYSGVSKVAFRSAENIGEMADYGYGLPAYNPLKTLIEDGIGAMSSNLASITRVGPGMFAGVYGTTLGPLINMPECLRVDDRAFCGVETFTRGPSAYSMPKLKYVGSSAFMRGYCISFYMPEVEYIGDYGFYYQVSATTNLTMSKLSCIGSNGFGYYGRDASSTITFVFSNCTTLGRFAFASCYYLADCQIPKVCVLPSSVFWGCQRLTNVDVTAATYVWNYAFYGCSLLSRIDLPNCSGISYNAFVGCSSLNTLSIGTNLSYVATLYNSSVFSRTSLTSTGGQIYVPSSLLTAYQSAAGWSYFSAIIHGV